MYLKKTQRDIIRETTFFNSTCPVQNLKFAYILFIFAPSAPHAPRVYSTLMNLETFYSVLRLNRSIIGSLTSPPHNRQELLGA